MINKAKIFNQSVADLYTVFIFSATKNKTQYCLYW